MLHALSISKLWMLFTSRFQQARPTTVTSSMPACRLPRKADEVAGPSKAALAQRCRRRLELKPSSQTMKMRWLASVISGMCSGLVGSNRHKRMHLSMTRAPGSSPSR